MNAIAQQLESIIGTDSICEWENLDISRQTGISRAIASDTSPNLIVYPKTPEKLAEVMACSYRNGWRVLPCGNATKLHWGGLVEAADLVVSTQRLNQIVEHAVGDLTLTAQAGAKFSQIQATLAEHQQYLALDPSYPDAATLGGIVATGDTGSLRQRYNGVRDQLIGVTFARSDGQLSKGGGRVVKNVAGYDLMKLMSGSFGTLGIVTQVTFRLYPIPDVANTVVLTGDAEAIAQAAQTLRGSALTPTAADILSPQLVREANLGEGMGLMARFHSVAASVEEQSRRLLEVGDKLGLGGTRYGEGDESQLWQKLRELIDAPSPESKIICKMGVIPTEAIALLSQLDEVFAEPGLARIHVGSGLGRLRLTDGEAIAPLLDWRSRCQSRGGFLTVLDAPKSVKPQLDVWGYAGNAINIMRRIKQQFDPKNLLSPHRFVGGI